MHGNIKYKFHQLVKVGDKINERPNNIYSLKAAFRLYNQKLERENKPKLEVMFNEYGGKRVEIELTGFKTQITTPS